MNETDWITAANGVVCKAGHPLAEMTITNSGASLDNRGVRPARIGHSDAADRFNIFMTSTFMPSHSRKRGFLLAARRAFNGL